MAKRGPKRKPVPREPNGRAMRSEPADRLALETRARHLMDRWGICDKIKVDIADLETGELTKQEQIVPISRQAATNPLLSTFVGTLYYTKDISQVQYEASQTYIKMVNQERKRIASKDTHYEPPESLSEAKSQDEMDTASRAQAERYGELQKAIQAAQNHHRGNLWTALSHCVLRDEPLHHMVGDLRLALNAVDHFVNPERVKKAA